MQMQYFWVTLILSSERPGRPSYFAIISTLFIDA